MNLYNNIIMPEINEVRRYADFIYSKLENKKITEINILNGRYKKHSPFEHYTTIKNKLPLKLIDIQTKGKLMYMEFEGNIFILVTLGLSGGWCFLDSKKYNNPKIKDYDFSEVENLWDNYVPDEEMDSYLINAIKHLNVEFKTNTGSLYFYDTLSFGTIKILTSVDELNKKLKTLGPDIMDETTTLDLFKQQIKKKTNLDKPIGNILMNQKVISGIGNYLRADVLYLSKVDPFRKVSKLSDNELKDIYNNSKILTWGDYDKEEAIKMKIINKSTKLPSDYERMFFVYQEETDIHGHKIIKKELYEGSQKRFIYYVPEIQK
jgi:formamidopyrimidine-DNA glycosylase